MSSNSKKDGKKATIKDIQNHNVKDYGNDPFFIQKAEASKKVMEKYGLPKQLLLVKK